MTLSINSKENKRSIKADRRRREREVARRQDKKQEARRMAQFRKNCVYRDEL